MVAYIHKYFISANQSEIVTYKSMIIKAVKSTLMLWPNEGQIKPLIRSQKKSKVQTYS